MTSDWSNAVVVECPYYNIDLERKMYFQAISLVDITNGKLQSGPLLFDAGEYKY